MGESRDFYKVPAMVRVHCRKCGKLLQGGDLYYMTEDSSWIYCELCASGPIAPEGPKQTLQPPHEREPLHKKRTLKEAAYM